MSYLSEQMRLRAALEPMSRMAKRVQGLTESGWPFSAVPGELRKRGVRLKLQDLPFRFLAALLETPGEIVPREELIGKLWSNGTRRLRRPRAELTPRNEPYNAG